MVRAVPTLMMCILGIAACGERAHDGARSWTRIDGTPQGDQARQLVKAEQASQSLFQSLSGRLQVAMQKDGPAAAVAVCREAAPGIAAVIEDAYGVRLGRTSFRLRNPSNAPPDWARPYVQERTEVPVHLAHPDGRFAALLPIRLKVGCLGCHGPAEAISPQVRSALETLYPEDRATGFAKGDLRGWFWIEVPKP